MAVNLQIGVDPSNAEEGLKKIGDAAEQAGDRAENALNQAGDAAKGMGSELDWAAEAASAGMSQASADTDRAKESTAAYAIQAGELRRNMADASKEITEGLARAAELALKTGDMGAASITFAEGAAKAIQAFNPMVGMVALAAVNTAKMAKAMWDTSVAAKQAADAMPIADMVKDAFQIDADIMMGYDALQSKIGAVTGAISTHEKAIEKLKEEQRKLLDEGLGDSDRYHEAKKQEEALYEAKKKLEHELENSRKASDEAKKIRDKELADEADKRFKETNRQITEIDAATKRRAELEKMSEQELNELWNEKTKRVKEASKSEEESRQLVAEFAEIEARINELRRKRAEEQKRDNDEFNKSLEEQRRRNEEVQKEAERIHNMDIKAAEEEKETRADLERIVRETRDALADETLSQEKQNELLKEMARAKQKMMDMDRKAAEDKKRADQEAAQRQAEAREADEAAKRKWAESKEGQQAAQAASSPQAVRDRIARDTGRKRGTVEGMMRRGEINEAEWSLAAQANLDEMWERQKKQQQSGDKTKDIITGKKRPENANPPKPPGETMADTGGAIREVMNLADNAVRGYENTGKELEALWGWAKGIESRFKAAEDAQRRRANRDNIA